MFRGGPFLRRESFLGGEPSELAQPTQSRGFFSRSGSNPGGPMKIKDPGNRVFYFQSIGAVDIGTMDNAKMRSIDLLLTVVRRVYPFP